MLWLASRRSTTQQPTRQRTSCALRQQRQLRQPLSRELTVRSRKFYADGAPAMLPRHQARRSTSEKRVEDRARNRRDPASLDRWAFVRVAGGTPANSLNLLSEFRLTRKSGSVRAPVWFAQIALSACRS